MNNLEKIENVLPDNYSYRPLGEGLYIGNSDIEGQGLFTNRFIGRDTNLGVTHFDLAHSSIKYSDELLRSPLGGWINSSCNPNCIITDIGQLDKPYYYLVTLRDILAGEELTCDYFNSACGNKINCKSV